MSVKKSAAPQLDIWEQIRVKQGELQALYTDVAENIFKATDGEAYLGEKNISYAEYWSEAVKGFPKVVSGMFNGEDFEAKTALFPLFVKAYNGHNAVGSVLNTPYDILAKDVLRYSTDAQKSFKSSNEDVSKQIVKDAPVYRKATRTPSVTEKAATEKLVAEKVSVKTLDLSTHN